MFLVIDSQMDIFEGAIGIDLGTTYSCVGVWVEDHVEILANDLGSRTTPSWVAFTESGERLIGDEAKSQASTNPTRTFYDIKRLIGRSLNEPKVQEAREQGHFSFPINGDQNDFPVIPLDSRTLKPEEISAMVLQKMRSIAEGFLKKKVNNAVITVPAYFNDAQRSATENAAKIAGLNCLRIINEPTAACLCYGIQNQKACNVLIFDLGGGTYDVSILSLNQGVFEVLSTNGDTQLGGEDFDHRLASYLRSEFERKHKRKIPDTASKSLRKLKEAAETAKRRLSTTEQVRVEIDSLYEGVDFQLQVTRTCFESLCADLFQSCLEPIRKALADAELRKDEIQEIVLVGGSTRIPRIQELLSTFFDGKTLNKSVNPDEAVAYGASIQGAILTKSDSSGKTKDLLLVDVIPLSLGIETTGGKMATIIPRNSSVPTEKSAMFTTVEDNQSVVLVQVFEGERKITKDNNRLGTFELTGLPKAIRGVPKIEVTFKLDANGILTVSAFEKDSQITQTVTISKDSGRLSEEEIARMVADADRYRIQDELKLEIIELRSAFERYLTTSQQTINDSEYQEALTVEERSYANQLILNTFDWFRAKDPDSDEVIERTKPELNDCKSAVEHYLKPLVNKVYGRKMATSAPTPDTNDSSTATASQINQILAKSN
jgi:heat shock protein 1/8